MWLVAEKSDPKAIEDFGARFPQYRSELGKRLALVRNLRGAKAQHSAPAVRPAFNPAVRFTPSPARFFGFGIAAGVAAISIASYYVVNSRSAAPAPIVKAPVESTGKELISKPGPAMRKENLILPKEYRYKEIPPISTAHDPALDHMPIEYGPAAEKAKPETAKDVDIRKAPLITALLMIAESNKIKLTLAPNLPNPNISVAYKGMSAKAMIKDLSAKYGVVAMDEGDNEILLLPKGAQPPADGHPSPKPDSPSADNSNSPSAPTGHALPMISGDKGL